MGIIDKYIIRKFLGTFFYAIALMILVAVIFDASEKMDDFIEKKAPLKAILLEYYLTLFPTSPTCSALCLFLLQSYILHRAWLRIQK